MKLGTWLGLAALVCAAGCSSSGKKTANQGDSKAVAEALSAGITIEHGRKLSGVIPKTTAKDVDVTQDDAPLTLAPSGDGLMSLDADNPDEADDPVEAMLLQFEDSSDHFEADVDATGDGGVADGGTGTKHYEVHFSVTDGICKNFCKGEFDGVMVQALKLHKGGVSKHVNRHFKLDCRRHGSETCDADKDTGKQDAGSKGNADSGGGGDNADAGGGSSGSTGGGTNSGVSRYLSALKTFSNAGCVCAGSKSMPPYCQADGAGLSKTAVDCVAAALNKDAAGSNGWAACAASALGTATTSCKTCSGGVCDASVAASAGDSCGTKLPSAVQNNFDACMLGETSGAPSP
jgi:hypothetical protein